MAKGALYQDPAFLSTTLKNIKDMNKFKTKTVHFYITSKTGKYIKMCAGKSYQEEEEVLFKPHTKFRIIKVEENGERAAGWANGTRCYNIYMEECD